jgi:hypothetical protein
MAGDAQGEQHRNAKVHSGHFRFQAHIRRLWGVGVFYCVSHCTPRQNNFTTMNVGVRLSVIC